MMLSSLESSSDIWLIFRANSFKGVTACTLPVTLILLRDGSLETRFIALLHEPLLIWFVCKSSNLKILRSDTPLVWKCFQRNTCTIWKSTDSNTRWPKWLVTTLGKNSQPGNPWTGKFADWRRFGCTYLSTEPIFDSKTWDYGSFRIGTSRLNKSRARKQYRIR